MSSEIPIPDEVRRFVLTSVPSVPYLEAMLLFHGARDTAHTRRDVAARLYITEQVADELLEALCAAGVLANREGHYRYAPNSDALAAAIDALAAAYATNLIGITNLLHDRTQRSAVRFADAFKLRKD
jgi:hypothetical protein